MRRATRSGIRIIHVSPNQHSRDAHSAVLSCTPLYSLSSYPLYPHTGFGTMEVRLVLGELLFGAAGGEAVEAAHSPNY